MKRIVLLLASCFFGCIAAAQEPDYSKVEIKTIALAPHTYMLMGAGGNMALSVGDDATFLIDDQFGPLTAKIQAAIAAVTDKPAKFILNTHWHFDHTGGNENLRGIGTVIVAHDNVRRRMSTDQFIEFLKRQVPASPPVALPVITFTDSVTFHLNGDDLVAFHVAPAHTDGDVLVHFPKSDIIHMGDTFITSGYPFVDLSSGGNINGVIGAADRALSICTAQTIVIPGHGQITDCAKLKTWRDMLATIRERVRAEMSANHTLEQIKAANPTAQFDNSWPRGNVRPENLVEFIYRSLGGK